MLNSKNAVFALVLPTMLLLVIGIIGGLFVGFNVLTIGALVLGIIWGIAWAVVAKKQKDEAEDDDE